MLGPVAQDSLSIGCESTECCRVEICLEHCLPTGGPEACDECSLHLPLPRDALALAFQGTALSQHRQDVVDPGRLHPNAKALLSGLPVDDRSGQPEALMLFLDGSFRSGDSSWAVVCLSFREACWRWWGYLADTDDNMHCTGDAFGGELFAQLVALSTVACSGLPTVICYDCTSAAEVARGSTKTCCDDQLRAATASVAAFVAARGHSPAFLHVKGHSGHPGNELADHIAKTAIRSQSGRAPVGDGFFNDYVEEGAFNWLWFFAATDRHRSMPTMQDDSTTRATSVWADTEVIRQPSQWAPPSDAPAAASYRIQCPVATYNTLSSATNLQRQCLQNFLETHRLAVFGLQECRQVVAPCVRVGGTLRLRARPRGAILVASSGLMLQAPTDGWTNRFALSSVTLGYLLYVRRWKAVSLPSSLGTAPQPRPRLMTGPAGGAC